MKYNLRELSGYLYHDSKFAKSTLRPIKAQVKRLKYNLKMDRRFNEQRHLALFGKELNLNNPKTFDDKIQWLKLYDRSPLHTQCADKYAVREVISNIIGKEYLIPLLYVTDDYRNINRATVSDGSVIKCNHDSMNVVIVESVNNVDFSEVQRKMRSSLRRNFYYRYREWQYKDIPPKIIVEKLIKDDEGALPADYKIFCFDGNPKYISVDSDRFGTHTRDIFDTDWKRQSLEYRYKHSVTPPPPPTNLDLMLELAKKLSAPFPFVRVDFYDTGSQVYFGEITFHPGAGFNPFKPPEWQIILGEQIPLRTSRAY